MPPSALRSLATAERQSVRGPPNNHCDSQQFRELRDGSGSAVDAATPHMLALDGVYVRNGSERPEFHELLVPEDEEIAQLTVSLGGVPDTSGI
jgi:hypothetical protein